MRTLADLVSVASHFSSVPITAVATSRKRTSALRFAYRNRVVRIPEESVLSLTGSNTLSKGQKKRVANTLEIRQWIRSMGPAAEVIEPGFLRAEFAEEAKELARTYRVKSRENS